MVRSDVHRPTGCEALAALWLVSLLAACTSDSVAGRDAENDPTERVEPDGDPERDISVDLDDEYDWDVASDPTTETGLDVSTDGDASGEPTVYVAPDGTEDAVSAACTQPDDLPDVTFTGDGRFRTLDTLSFPGLSSRRVRVYLPVAYETETSRRFPVLYMHDGQNLFDPAEAAFGMAWEVDQTLDRLTAEGLVPATILVAIDNTEGERLDDYTPVYDATVGAGGDGDLYADRVAMLLKPLIDRHFRTQCERTHTVVVGSSLGGLISLHIALRHPEIFGRVGAVSPSLWWGDRWMIDAFEGHSGALPERLWIDIGNDERLDLRETVGVPGLEDGVVDCRQLRDLALSRGMVWGNSLGYLEEPNGFHDEHAWAYRLESILLFLLSEDLPDTSAPAEPSLTVYGAALPRETHSGQTNLAVEARFGSLRLTVPNEAAMLESLTPAVATVADDGTVSAVADGTALIRASWGGLSATDTIEVVPQLGALVAFDVTVPDWTPPEDAIYLAGSVEELGAWQTDGLALRQRGPHQWVIGVDIAPGTPFEFKVTRGTWETVEKDANGDEIGNRQGTATDGAVIRPYVETWADD